MAGDPEYLLAGVCGAAHGQVLCDPGHAHGCAAVDFAGDGRFARVAAGKFWQIGLREAGGFEASGEQFERFALAVRAAFLAGSIISVAREFEDALAKRHEAF